MKKIGSILSTTIIIILVLAIVAVIVPKCFGVQFRAVLTASMEPDMPVGSLVVIVPKDFKDINIGDDISFVRDKNLTVVTHRIIEKNSIDETFTTQGISNNAADVPTSYKNVIGVVKCTIPGLGYPVSWLNTLSGKIISISIIAGLVLISILLGFLGKKPKPIDSVELAPEEHGEPHS